MKIAAVVVTHNPEPSRFIKVFNSVTNQVNGIVIVDNNSTNRKLVESLCNKVNKCLFIGMRFNSGIAYALRMGINRAVNCFDCEWVLLLDDDTVLLEGAIRKAFEIYENMPSSLRDRIGLLALTSVNGDCRVQEIVYGIFSGSIVKSEVAAKACCRDNFFLDQADFDFYARVRELGYLTLSIRCKLVDHKLGETIWIPIISNIVGRPLPYEPPWRFYYLVRNSTILLRESKMDFHFYINQLVSWGAKILFRDGVLKAVKPLCLGLFHALLKREGFLDPMVFE